LLVACDTDSGTPHPLGRVIDKNCAGLHGHAEPFVPVPQFAGAPLQASRRHCLVRGARWYLSQSLDHRTDAFPNGLRFIPPGHAEGAGFHRLAAAAERGR